MELKRVVVTGMGAITPLGNSITEYWNNLRNGVSGADFITQFDASKFKTRFACDGLRTQRLTTPLVRRDKKFAPATWEQALTEIAAKHQALAPEANEFKVIAGHLVEIESLVAMKDLVNRLGSDNLALDQPGGGGENRSVRIGDCLSSHLFRARRKGNSLLGVRH